MQPSEGFAQGDVAAILSDLSSGARVWLVLEGAKTVTDNGAVLVLGAGVNIMERPDIGFRAGVDAVIVSRVPPAGRFTVGGVPPFGRR